MKEFESGNELLGCRVVMFTTDIVSPGGRKKAILAPVAAMN
jgi:hypothetical protein